MFMVNPHRFGGAYPANAVTFDGVGDFLQRSTELAGVADGREFTLSFWLNTTGLTGSERILTEIKNSGETGNVARFLVTMRDTNIQLQAKGADGSNRIAGILATSINDGNWHHVMMSASLVDGSPVLQISIDDIVVANSITLTQGTIEFTRNRCTIGGPATGTAGLYYEGDLAEFYFDTTYRDLSITSNRRSFVSSDGKPVRRANGGVIWLSGEDWATNKGTGGNFALFGALTTSTNLPVEL